MTTIKVPKSLRERLSRDAARAGLTSAGFIAQMLDVYERQARFRAVRRAYQAIDPSYAAETGEWDTLADDGLEP